jgi:hypothetical protein
MPLSRNEETHEVNVNRTEILDASHDRLGKAWIILPRQTEMVREFAKHRHNLARKLEEETGENGQKTGKKRYAWVR